MKIRFKQRGHFGNLEKLLKIPVKERLIASLDKYGKMGVEALAEATPKDTGLTSQSWGYHIESGNGFVKLCFDNSNVADGWAPIALLIQYGHATRNGGWVEGVDYINPALRPLFKKLAHQAWEEVSK